MDPSPLSPVPQAMLQGLTPAQREAASYPGATLVLAGAGTGKTRTLTTAVAWRIGVLGIRPSRILAVTFTNKAAQEMRERITAALGDAESPEWIGTFHGIAARQRRSEPEVANLRPGFSILDAEESRRLLKRTMLPMLTDGQEDTSDPKPVKQISAIISSLKDKLVGPDDAKGYVEAMIADARQRHRMIDPDLMRLAANVYPHYQRHLREANSADFGDLLLWPTRAMRTSESYRRRWAERFDCLLADEYQDANLVQYTWLRLLGKDHRNIFVVGDDDQSIYGFRGADISFIRRFALDFPEARQVRLEENFRSTRHILDAANAVIAQDPNRLGKTLWTKKEAGCPIEIVPFHDPDDEAFGLAAEIERRHTEGLPPEHIAVLYRSNWISRGLEEALMRRRIPYVLIGDVGFYQRAEIKDALALLQLVTTPDDRQSDEAFRRVCNTPGRGFGPKALQTLEIEATRLDVSLVIATATAPLAPKAGKAIREFVDSIRSVAKMEALTVAASLSLLLDKSGYRQMLRDSRSEDTEGRMENLQELVEMAEGFHSAVELLDHAALATAAPNEVAGGRVSLMTLHRAKGLEFPHVFLAGWDSAIFPSPYGDPEEERRLAYVGLTRGMRQVTVSYCNYRRGSVQPACFIDEIPKAHKIPGWLYRQGQRQMPRNDAALQRAKAELDALWR